ncbi:hypothetical protein LZ31DRAFT_355737 [Colletotrichum somersetense]|nr:hypothetical protein LZ31DRAFT_355737 [Colletotrichum somersetense]
MGGFFFCCEKRGHAPKGLLVLFLLSLAATEKKQHPNLSPKEHFPRQSDQTFWRKAHGLGRQFMYVVPQKRKGKRKKKEKKKQTTTRPRRTGVDNPPRSRKLSALPPPPPKHAHARRWAVFCIPSLESVPSSSNLLLGPTVKRRGRFGGSDRVVQASRP